MKRIPRRLTMQTKLNALVIGSILAVAIGLILISYYIFCQRVDSKYYNQIQHAAIASATNVEPGQVKYFWSEINTDEFRDLHDRAVAADDEQLIRDWLQNRPGYYTIVEFKEDPDEEENGDEVWSLLSDYEDMLSSLSAVKAFLDVDAAYYQYSLGGITYNIADPDEDLFYIGTQEEPIEEFEQYEGNAAVPPVVYRSSFGWLYTAIEPITNPETEEVVGTAGVDINMTDIVQERYMFLHQSLVFVAVLLAVAIVSSVILLQRTAVNPLRQLADAATRFAKEDRAFTKDDIIHLDIKTNDEVSDLYQEIQCMESRIVDYTEHLTAVTAERERVSTELRTASQIQESMLPNIFPAFPDRNEFALYAVMTPAKEVGGDFYDFFLIDDKHLAVLIADVSDKGIPAALFMMSTKILINDRAQLGGSPGEILRAVNTQICKSNKARMFVTVWMGILDLESGVMTCSNAGHEYPVIRSGDGIFRILKEKHGLPVGAMAASRYHNYEICMMPGDAIFVYTDGVPEANNAEGDFYGMKRMIEALNRYADRDPKHILSGIKADVDGFTDEAKQFDDLTMLCLEYKGNAEHKQEETGGNKTV